MRFPNAQAGVKKLYTAQLLNLISAICIIVTGIMIAIAAAAALGGSLEGGVATFGGSLIFTIAAAVLSIIAIILMILGLSRAQHDDNNFRIALWCAIANIVLTIVSAILTGSPVVASILALLAGLAGVFTTYFAIMGIKSIAEQLGDSSLAARAQKIMWLVIIVYFVGVILRFVSGLLTTGAGATVAGIIAILAGIAEIVAFFLYLGLLKKAKESFKA